MHTLLMDLRYGLRMLRRNPGFAAAAVAILALGIGANATIFSVVNALVLKPLPYPNQDRLVFVSEGNEKLKSWGAASFPDFEDWKSQNKVFDRMGVLSPEAVNIAGGGDPERVSGVRASCDMISLLGAVPRLGRSFNVDDGTRGAAPVVLLSDTFWKRRFGANPGIIGASLKVDTRPHSIVGVLPAEFRLGPLLGFEPEIWLPVGTGDATRDARTLIAIACLKPGITAERAEADLNLIQKRLADLYPETNAGWKIQVSGPRGTVDPAAYVFLTLLVCSVLGIVCTNVANLLLARASGREKELAVRAALGAGRARLARQLFSEGALLACAGTGLGVLVACWTCGLIRAGAAGTNLEIADVRPDIRVLGATALLFVATAVVVALFPALKLSRVQLAQGLRNGMSAAAGAPKRRFRAALIAAEVMLSVVLLSGAGLVIKSWIRLWQIDPGHRVEQILTASVNLPRSRYPEPRQQEEFFVRLLGRLESRSEVISAGIISAVPTWGPQAPFHIIGRARPRQGEGSTAGLYRVSPRFFETMGIASLAGRLFNDADTASAPQVAVVNRTLAQRFWPGRNSLGEQIEIEGRLRTIVGIIGDLRSVPLHKTAVPEIWVPFLQAPSTTMMLTLRTRSDDPLKVCSAIRQETGFLDPDQPVARLRTMEQVRMQDMGVIQTGTRLLGFLACGAVLLASIGIYGVLSHSVSGRSAEFGIRMALGARRADVLALVLREGFTLTLFGLIPGILASLALGKVVSSRLFGVRPVEPLILGGLALLLTAISLLACTIPARRATRVDPVVALRCQ